MATSRRLEQAGDSTGAINAYMKARAPVDAARVMAAIGQFNQAGAVLLQALHLKAAEVGTLTGVRRSVALMAAEYLARGTKMPDALMIWRALGQRFEGAKILWNLDRPRDAAVLLKEDGRWVQAATCLLEVADHAGAWECLAEVGPEHPEYRPACVRTLQLLEHTHADPHTLAERLGPWLASAPQNLAELQGLYLLAIAYDEYGNIPAAMQLYERVASKRPGHRSVEARLLALRDRTSDSFPEFETLESKAKAESQADIAGGVPEEVTGYGVDIPDAPVKKPRKPAARPAPGTRPPRGRRKQPPTARPADGQPIKSPSVSFQLPPPPLENEEPSAPEPRVDVFTTAPARPKRPATRAKQQTRPSQVAPAAGRSQADEHFGPGIVVNDRYTINELLGEGATATVYRAMDHDLGDEIALKVFHAAVSRNDLLSERMKLEIRLCRKLSHVNIIKIFDMGSYLKHRFLTMELLEGSTLKDILRGPVSMERGLRYLSHACRGLHEAHRAGFVHRDVKPDNLFVTHEDVVKVMDFGIAKATTSDGLTLTGTILGTPGFMAPEQIDGSAAVTQAADQYAIGSIAYRMLTGRMVFEHDEMMPLLMMHTLQAPEPPSGLNPRISADLEHVVLTLLAKKPDERFASCAEVADLLETLSKG